MLLGRSFNGDTVAAAVVADPHLDHICIGAMLRLGGVLQRVFQSSLNSQIERSGFSRSHRVCCCDCKCTVDHRQRTRTEVFPVLCVAPLA